MVGKRILETWRKVKNKKTGVIKKVKVKGHLRKPRKIKSKP